MFPSHDHHHGASPPPPGENGDRVYGSKPCAVPAGLQHLAPSDKGSAKTWRKCFAQIIQIDQKLLP